jgi:hypothetical protein
VPESAVQPDTTKTVHEVDYVVTDRSGLAANS